MKSRIIVLISVLTLSLITLSAVCTLAAITEDGFESYGLGAWAPSGAAGDNDWNLLYQGTGVTLNITTDAHSGNQGVLSDSSNVSDDGNYLTWTKPVSTSGKLVRVSVWEKLIKADGLPYVGLNLRIYGTDNKYITNSNINRQLGGQYQSVIYKEDGTSTNFIDYQSISLDTWCKLTSELDYTGATPQARIGLFNGTTDYWSPWYEVRSSDISSVALWMVGKVQFDDAKIEVVPEPSTLIFLASGSSLLAYMRRRRKSL